VLTFDTQVQEQVDGGYVQSDGFVKPSDTLHYSATVKNELLSSYMQGLLSTSFPPAQDAGTMLPQSFILQPTQEKTISGTVGVSASAATGVYSLTQSAGALITDWSVLSKGAKLWLPMDDPTLRLRSVQAPRIGRAASRTSASLSASQRCHLYQLVSVGDGRPLRQRAEPERIELPVLAGRSQ
jgi:hypothetical protein